jgi:hypothetical protein
MIEQGEMAQNLRQFGLAELAGSTGAVGKRRQANTGTLISGLGHHMPPRGQWV